VTKLTISIIADSDRETLRVLLRMAANMQGGMSDNGLTISYDTGSGVANVSHIPEHSSTEPNADQHNPLCDCLDINPDGIRKPCNCGFAQAPGEGKQR
jgi:hypothetical protein